MSCISKIPDTDVFKATLNICGDRISPRKAPKRDVLSNAPANAEDNVNQKTSQDGGNAIAEETIQEDKSRAGTLSVETFYGDFVDFEAPPDQDSASSDEEEKAEQTKRRRELLSKEHRGIITELKPCSRTPVASRRL